MAFLTIQHSENNSAGLHSSLLGATTSLFVLLVDFHLFAFEWSTISYQKVAANKNME